MNRDNPAKHFIFAFVIALAGYIIFYHFIENRRTRKGPWQVTFTTNSPGNPELVINQPILAISNVQIRFPRMETNQTAISNYQSPITFAFSQPKPVPYDVPFGKCVFMDTTFQPGTLTFQMFGHEIELLPRVLVLDRREHPWRSDEVISLTSDTALTNLTTHSTLK